MPGTKELSRTKKDYLNICNHSDSIAIGELIRRTEETIAIKQIKLDTLKKEYIKKLKAENGL